jgi:hypothetical protein
MTKRVVGGAILLVGTLLFAPIPLSNVPPALVIILLSLAYLEAYHSASLSPPHSSCSRLLREQSGRPSAPQAGQGVAVNPLRRQRS